MRHAWLLGVFALACSAAPQVDPKRPPSVKVETLAELDVGPGNIAVTADRRIFLSLHQFYEPEQRVVELHPGKPPTVVPLTAGGPKLDSVLGIRADDRGVIWMLDNAMRGKGSRKLVGQGPAPSSVEEIDLMGITHDDAFLNDLAVDRTHGTIYIADPAGGKTAAIIVVDLATKLGRRVLEGHASVVPGDVDLVIDGKPVQIKLPDGTVIRPHVGINPIALDALDTWLYFGPMHGTLLYRIPTAALRDAALSPETLASKIETYAERPITDGISIDNAGNIYLGDLANNAIGMIDKDRRYHRIASGPELSWIDAFSFGPDGKYYVVANQLHRSATLNAGVDETRKPFRILTFTPFAPGHVGR